jgi:hypothetical protein
MLLLTHLSIKDDFEQFAWTIVFLAMGGIALGKGVTSSGLLVTMDGVIHRLLEGLSLYTVVLVLSPVVLVCNLFCDILPYITKYSSDRIDIHQPYYRKRATCAYREGGWTKPTWQPRKSTDIYDGSPLLCWHGDACFWVS